MSLHDAIENTFKDPRSSDALVALNAEVVGLSEEERDEVFAGLMARIDERRAAIEGSEYDEYTKQDLLRDATQYRLDWNTLEGSWPEFPEGDAPPVLRLVSIVQLDTTPFTDPRGAEKLLGGLERVVSLTMDMTEAFTLEDARRLVGSPAMASVETLWIEAYENEDTEEVPVMGVDVFGGLMTGLPNLKDVYIAQAGLDDDALVALSNMSECKIEHLNLRENHFTKRGIEALARAPLTSLESLCLVQYEDELGPEELRILGDSPHLGALRDLTGFYGCPGGWEVIRASKTFSEDLCSDC